jgi:flavin reductase (DIM6/NTAB) family NADH-FMN oxidoreductase RutF
VTVDLRGAMRPFVTEACVTTTYLDDATSRRLDGLMASSPTLFSLDPLLVSVCLRHHSAVLADPLKSRDARAAVLRTVSATPGGRSMATGQPSLITTRCKEHT